MVAWQKKKMAPIHVWNQPHWPTLSASTSSRSAGLLEPSSQSLFLITPFLSCSSGRRSAFWVFHSFWPILTEGRCGVSKTYWQIEVCGIIDTWHTRRMCHYRAITANLQNNIGGGRAVQWPVITHLRLNNLSHQNLSLHISHFHYLVPALEVIS